MRSKTPRVGAGLAAALLAAQASATPLAKTEHGGTTRRGGKDEDWFFVPGPVFHEQAARLLRENGLLFLRTGYQVSFQDTRRILQVSFLLRHVEGDELELVPVVEIDPPREGEDWALAVAKALSAVERSTLQGLLRIPQIDVVRPRPEPPVRIPERDRGGTINGVTDDRAFFDDADAAAIGAPVVVTDKLRAAVYDASTKWRAKHRLSQDDLLAAAGAVQGDSMIQKLAVFLEVKV